MMPNERCPVCSSKLITPPTNHEKYDALIYNCPQCGKYVWEQLTMVDRNFQDSKQLISAWIRRYNKRENTTPFIGNHFFDEDWFKNLHNMGFPETVSEKLDELLRVYANMVKDDFTQIVAVENHPELVSDIAAKNLTEIIWLNGFLAELEYIQGPFDVNDVNRVRLTAKGWQRIDELNKSISTSDSAFMAMWFDPQTNHYREAAKKAITACGYKPVIVDDTDFNNFIMDEVITLIRQARFLVADLTCRPEDINSPKVTGGVRGGVYWEAGMAYGMGKAVIQTCRKDDESSRRIHFDLNQYNAIWWEEGNLTKGHIEIHNHVNNPSFAQELAQRIMATVGEGSYTSPSE